MTQLRASASANRELWVGSAQTASPASGASPAVAPVSVMAMQICVTPTLENVETAGTTLQDTCVNGKKGSLVVNTSSIILIYSHCLIDSQLCGRILWKSSAGVR